MANDVEKAKEIKAEKPEKPQITKKAYEATYTIAELVDASAKFQTNRSVVRAALSKAGKKAYTMREATQLIERMKNKEVRV